MFVHDVFAEWQQRPEYKRIVDLPPPPSVSGAKEMLAYFDRVVTYPAKPGSDVCMLSPAMVMVGGPDFEAECESISLKDLTPIGKLQLMVTDVEQTFPDFKTQMGGRSMGGVRVLGFVEDGMVFVGGKIADRPILPALHVGGRSYIFAKSLMGEWLLPAGDDKRSLVLLAESDYTPLSDAIDVAQFYVQAAGVVAAPAWEATTGAVNKGLEEGSKVVAKGLEEGTKVVAPAWEATTGAVNKGLEEGSKVVAPAWEATSAAVAPAWQATSSVISPAWEATSAAVAPAWEMSSAVLAEAGSKTWEASSKTWEASGAALAEASSKMVSLADPPSAAPPA